MGSQPLIHLDHVIVTLEPAAYEDLVADEFVRTQFGRFDLKTASSSISARYTSAALAGVSTFLEFFDARAPLQEGMIAGIIFSLEKPGDIEKIRQRLEQELDGNIEYMLNKREVDGYDEPMPFYHLVQLDYGERSPFWSTVAQADPWYLGFRGVEREPDGRATRRAYLDTAFEAPLRPQHYMQDVVEIELVLDRERAAIFRRKLLALGFAEKDNEIVPSYANSEILLRVVDSEDQREGIRRVRTSLRRPKEGTREYRFGRGAVLHFEDDRTALWTFELPPARQRK